MGSCCGKEKKPEAVPPPRPVQALPKHISASYTDITEYRTPSRRAITQYQVIPPETWTPYYHARQTLSGTQMAYEFDPSSRLNLERICDMKTPSASVRSSRRSRGYNSSNYETIRYDTSSASRYSSQG
ncbi:hypothetical protein VHEMI08108 [[Torrubiella] hemipterigena]|uniref:Uncharacterized protein n=1 Tax=[Torrubiella] hemipterigena TaxID=1531966 RepID=A0A0A1T5K9_9HYPO|nr:hypothetical protein VHEMI08108 [[Torrubiella] hemipterigena]